ncbi:MATE efflux family protein [Gottschalkia acidurici 9a]|uniref:MATE efflux family protein n=1 Tax=Gottschalkia acidurici (strain ATCC 7906 / DSM 604 / BCRC 14475 / CIP 104303 / KCTC 5404 / NCIMB 10678 / 9a) TaxID=1128398 RepID=K0B3A8_GOTA9|nr:MATE family efflux transporter [Gottschalkia acidurici]AFS79121.1 MATE efflux family protein [Gottschalkia acidurici 9a]
MAYNGSSEAITQLCGGLSTMLFNWILIKKFGEVGISAFATVQYISLVINAIIIGISRGVAAIISVNFGGRLFNRVKHTLTLAIKTVTIVGFICTIVLLIFKNPLISIFIQDNQEVFLNAQEIIVYYSFNFIFVGANVVINTFYTAINDPKRSAVLAISRYLLLIGCFIVLPFILETVGLWLSFAIAEIICLIISCASLKRTQYTCLNS